MREAAAAALLLVAAIAGCIGTDPAGDAPDTPRTSPVAESHDLDLASDPSDASEIWGFLPAVGDADGEVTATRVETPTGAEGMVVAPLIDEADRDKIESLAYTTVVIHRDRAYPTYIALNPTLDQVQRDGVERQESTLAPTFEPIWMPTPSVGEVGLLFAVKASEPIDVGLTYRFRSLSPVTDPGFEVPERTAIALEHLPDEPGRLAEPTGGAGGFSVPLYADINVGGTDGWEIRSRAISVDDGVPTSTRPTATLRDLTLSSSHDVASGWSVATGLYSNLDGAGNWSLHADLHGETIRDQGQFAVAEPATDNRSSLPAFIAMNGGAGSSEIAFDVTMTGANLQEHLIFLQLQVAATMDEMFGAGGFTYLETKGTDLGQDARLDESGLTLSPGDVTVRVPGLGGGSR